jgi:hypothetical protein
LSWRPLAVAGVLMFQNEVTNVRRDDCCKVGRSSAKYYKVAIHEKHNWMCMKFLFFAILLCVFGSKKIKSLEGWGHCARVAYAGATFFLRPSSVQFENSVKFLGWKRREPGLGWTFLAEIAAIFTTETCCIVRTVPSGKIVE